MTAPLTYREAIERIAELEAAADDRARIVLIAAAYDRLVRALEPVLGQRHVDEPMVIHDIRAAMTGVEDEIRDAKRE